MWIKVEDTKRPITGVTLTWAIDLSVDANDVPTDTYGEVTLTSSATTFSSYNTNSVIQVSEFDDLTDELNNTCEESVFLKVKQVVSNSIIKCEVHWPKTTSVKRFNKYGDARKTSYNTANDYKEAMLSLLDDLVAGLVLDTDYKVYNLTNGINHKWQLYDSSQILSIVDGRKTQGIDDNDMYFTTCCSYAYIQQRETEGVLTPAVYNTSGTVEGALGPFFNITDELSTLLMACDSCGGGYYMDTSAAAKKVEATTTTTGNQSSNMYALDSENGGDRESMDRSNIMKDPYNRDGSRKKPPIKDSDSSTKFYK